MVNGSTNLLGILGNPLGHSLSPAMHNAALEALGLNLIYVPLPVEPERIGNALAGLKALGFVGANVTIPHKESVIPFLDELSPDASCIGAVNTMLIRDDKLLGYNTDWTGFLNHLSEIGFDPSGIEAMVMGSGGSARAVVYALCSRGAGVTICSRNPSSTAAIIGDMSKLFGRGSFKCITPGDLGKSDLSPDIVVNTTPLGMTPNDHQNPWPGDVPFPKCKLAYDLVYNPKKTTFMKAAENSGVAAANGLGMLVHQAAASFKIWTGLEPPIQTMKKAI